MAIEDDFSNGLLPGDIGDICSARGWRALRTTGNGDCLYNSISLLLKGENLYFYNSSLEIICLVKVPFYYGLHLTRIQSALNHLRCFAQIASPRITFLFFWFVSRLY